MVIVIFFWGQRLHLYHISVLVIVIFMYFVSDCCVNNSNGEVHYNLIMQYSTWRLYIFQCFFAYNHAKCNPLVVYNSMFLARFIIHNAFSHMAKFITHDKDFFHLFWNILVHWVKRPQCSWNAIRNMPNIQLLSDHNSLLFYPCTCPVFRPYSL